VSFSFAVINCYLRLRRRYSFSARGRVSLYLKK